MRPSIVTSEPESTFVTLPASGNSVTLYSNATLILSLESSMYAMIEPCAGLFRKSFI